LFFLCILSKSFYAQYDISTAYGYLGFILEKQKDVSEAMWEYTKTSAHSGKGKKVDKKKSELVKTIQDVNKEIAQMPPFEGDMSLRDSVVFFFNYAISMLNGEYAEVERLEVLAEKSYHAMKAYLDAAAKANEKFQQSQDRIMAQIDIFASQNDITLTEGTSKTTANLKISNIVYSYSNQIYLIYFRGALEDNFIVEAINNSDTLLLKLHIDSLTAAYKLGEDEIKGISAYNRDNSLVLACKKSIAHYKKQATVSLPKILEYYRAEDYFNKVKAKYDAKSQ